MRPSLAILLIALACSGDKQNQTDSGPTSTQDRLENNFGVEEVDGDEDCDNLLLSSCLYPFPSDAYLVDGTLKLPKAGMPGGGQIAFEPESFERFSAFGASSPVLFQLPGAAVPELFPLDGASGLRPDSHVIAIDASTGARIPGWLETDFLAQDADPTLFTFRPAVPWPRGSTIVIGIQGMQDDSGGVVEAPEPFAALRDSQASTWRGVHSRRAHFEEVVFPALEAGGVARSDLQLAWSFTVRTDEEATQRLLDVRDTIFAALPAGGPDYTLDTVYDCPMGGLTNPPECHPSIRTIIDATIFVPSVLLPADSVGVRRIRVDGDGKPVIDGVEAWPFRLQIPHTAYDLSRTEGVPVLQYGHGFLGSADEANNGWLRDMAERKGLMVIATTMQGMSEDDGGVWAIVLFSNGGRFPELVEPALQGVVNQLVQQRLVKTSLAADPHPALHREDGSLVFDPARLWYHGNSQGGSVGTVVMGTSLDVTRGDLGVPGSGYPFLLHRSVDFTPFERPIASVYPEPDSVSRFLAMLGTGWDDFDPLTFAPHIHGDPLPGTPDHEALLHVAKEDRQVHNEASFILGRASGASLMVPAVRDVFDLPQLPYPASPGVALVEVDFMVPDDPTPLDPPDGDPTLPDDGDTHGWLRRWEPAQDQMVHFFETGELIDVCGGEPCVTEPDP